MTERTVGTTPPTVLTIAGTDSGGGAGVAADLRAMAACGAHGCVAVTAVTVQNTVGVSDVHPIPPATVAAQIETVATDIALGAVKTGMLADTPIIEAIVDACDRVGIGGDGVPLVIDPVAASMHGDPLLADAALDAYRTLIFPRAVLATPNLDEVRLLADVDVHDRAAQYEAAKMMHAFGSRYVLIKGGHLREDTDVCVDLLYDGHTFTELPGPRFATGNTHCSGDKVDSVLEQIPVGGPPQGMTVAGGSGPATSSGPHRRSWWRMRAGDAAAVGARPAATSVVDVRESLEARGTDAPSDQAARPGSDAATLAAAQPRR